MSSEYGAEERRLLESLAGEIYREAINAGAIAPDDPRLSDQDEAAPAMDLLIGLGLLALDPMIGAYVAVDPSTVQSRVVAPMGQQAAELLSESSQWANAFGALGQAFRRSPAEGSPVTEVRGQANINRFLQAVVGDADHELLTAQPGTRSPAHLALAVERDVRALQRGVSMRTLYQHSTRRSMAAREYVDRVGPLGAGVRTLDEFFNRLIIVDRRLAVVPGAEGDQVAVAVTDRNLVAYLADIFERYWERARDFTDRDESTARDIADDVHNMTVRMLVEGHSDHASAKRVGVSTRTYAGYVASLKDEYGAQTRFQLGYAMGQRKSNEGRRRKSSGPSGPEDVDPD